MYVCIYEHINANIKYRSYRHFQAPDSALQAKFTRKDIILFVCSVYIYLYFQGKLPVHQDCFKRHSSYISQAKYFSSMYSVRVSFSSSHCIYRMQQGRQWETSVKTLRPNSKLRVEWWISSLCPCTTIGLKKENVLFIYLHLFIFIYDCDTLT